MPTRRCNTRYIYGKLHCPSAQAHIWQAITTACGPSLACSYSGKGCHD
jgi:hypothetical protein